MTTPSFEEPDAVEKDEPDAVEKGEDEHLTGEEQAEENRENEPPA